MKFHMIITWIVSLALFSGCATSPTPVIIGTRDVARAGGQPEVEKMVDLGTGPAVTELGDKIDARGGQGRVVIGELLYIQGNNFGKQPRISIAGRGALVLAHTEGGGIVVRVPWGIDHGKVEVEIVHSRGRGTTTLQVDRLGVALGGGKLYPFRLHPDGKVTGLKPLELPGARFLSISHDGSAAYAIGGEGEGRLWVIDFTGPGPKLVQERKLGKGTPLAVVAASQRPMGAVVTEETITLFSSDNALNPTLYAPVAIPVPLQKKGVIAAGMGGQARTLGLLLSDLNEVALINMTDPTKLSGHSLIKVLPGEVLSLTTGLSFSADGGSAWVVSGDNARSVEGGLQPARLTMLQVTPGADKETAPSARVHKTWQVGQELTPMRLAVARGEPIPPGTSIRSEPSSTAVYVALAPSKVLSKVSADRGMLRRSSLGQEPLDLLEGKWMLTSQDVVGKTQRAVAAGCTGEAGKLKLVVVSGPAWEKGKVESVELGAIEGDGPCMTDIKVQP